MVWPAATRARNFRSTRSIFCYVGATNWYLLDLRHLRGRPRVACGQICSPSIFAHCSARAQASLGSGARSMSAPRWMRISEQGDHADGVSHNVAHRCGCLCGGRQTCRPRGRRASSPRSRRTRLLGDRRGGQRPHGCGCTLELPRLVAGLITRPTSTSDVWPARWSRRSA